MSSWWIFRRRGIGLGLAALAATVLATPVAAGPRLAPGAEAWLLPAGATIALVDRSATPAIFEAPLTGSHARDLVVCYRFSEALWMAGLAGHGASHQLLFRVRVGYGQCGPTPPSGVYELDQETHWPVIVFRIAGVCNYIGAASIYAWDGRMLRVLFRGGADVLTVGERDRDGRKGIRISNRFDTPEYYLVRRGRLVWATDRVKSEFSASAVANLTPEYACGSDVWPIWLVRDLAIHGDFSGARAACDKWAALADGSDSLEVSCRARIREAVTNARGELAMEEGRVQDALTIWGSREARKAFDTEAATEVVHRWEAVVRALPEAERVHRFVAGITLEERVGLDADVRREQESRGWADWPAPVHEAAWLLVGQWYLRRARWEEALDVMNRAGGDRLARSLSETIAECIYPREGDDRARP